MAEAGDLTSSCGWEMSAPHRFGGDVLLGSREGLDIRSKGKLRHKEGAQASSLAGLPPRSYRTVYTSQGSLSLPRRTVPIHCLSLTLPEVGVSPEGRGQVLVTFASLVPST